MSGLTTNEIAGFLILALLLALVLVFLFRWRRALKRSGSGFANDNQLTMFPL